MRSLLSFLLSFHSFFISGCDVQYSVRLISLTTEHVSSLILYLSVAVALTYTFRSTQKANATTGGRKRKAAKKGKSQTSRPLIASVANRRASVLSQNTEDDIVQYTADMGPIRWSCEFDFTKTDWQFHPFVITNRDMYFINLFKRVPPPSPYGTYSCKQNPESDSGAADFDFESDSMYDSDWIDQELSNWLDQELSQVQIQADLHSMIAPTPSTSSLREFEEMKTRMETYARSIRKILFTDYAMDRQAYEASMAILDKFAESYYHDPNERLYGSRG